MAKKIIVGDMAVTGDSQIVGDMAVTGDSQILGSCTVTGETVLNGPVEATAGLAVSGGALTAATISASGNIVATGSIQCADGYLLSSGSCLIIPNNGSGSIGMYGSTLGAAAQGSITLCIDADATPSDTTSALYVMKNTLFPFDFPNVNTLAKLDQNGVLTLAGGITADGLALNSSACAIAPNSGNGVISLTGSTVTAASRGNLVLCVDSDGTYDDTSSALYIMKNTTAASDSTYRMAKLDQYGDLTLLGGITANGLSVTPSACVISPGAGAGVVSLAGQEVTVGSRSNLVLAIDSDNSSNDATSCLYVMKNTDDKDDVDNMLVKLDQYGRLYLTGSIGSLHTAGGVIPFTGAHVYPSAEDLSNHVGSALVLVDGERVELSSADSSKNVVGLLISCQAKGDTETSSLGPVPESLGYICHVAAVGDSRTSQLQGASVCNEGGDIEAGDLLVTSSRPGYLMKQEDDIIRSSTVAKAMQPVNFSDDGVATGVYAYVYCG